MLHSAGGGKPHLCYTTEGDRQSASRDGGARKPRQEALRHRVKDRCPEMGMGKGRVKRGMGELGVNECGKGRHPAGGKRDGNIWWLTLAGINHMP